MRYGYFDDGNLEYVITRPDTPTPWINYIGAGKYGGIVSNTGGGYSFDRDPKNKRILRYRYNAIPADQPGRYVYIRDDKSKRYWSATWSPTYHEYNKYECRHGLGYTTIKTENEGIESQITYFVPDNDKALELWVVKVKNNSKRPRKLRLFSYCEFSFYEALKDQTNVDWCQQINQAEIEEGAIFWTAFMKTMGYTFFATDQKVKSYDTDREKFIGPYRSLANPIAVEKGKCSNSQALRGNGCGSLEVDVALKSGEEKELVFILGTADKVENGQHLIKKYQDPKHVQEALVHIKNQMKRYLSHLSAKTQDPAFDSMLNVWNQYQCKCTFNWSRFVSLYQLGVNRGMGFRDTAQDTFGVMHTIPQEAKETIVKLLKIQYKEGYAAHQYYPLTGETESGDAAEGAKAAPKWYSDDHLWIVLAVSAYVKETGDTKFINELVPYINDGAEPVFKHLQRAIDYSVNHVGDHGLCLIGWADWDDTLNLDTGAGKAESVWSTLLLGVALQEMAALCKAVKKESVCKIYHNLHKHFQKKVNTAGWDGKWYLRAYTEQGSKIGSSKNEYAKIYLLTQSWAVMSGFADAKKAEMALKMSDKYLNTKYGLVLLYPAYDHFDWRIGGTSTYPPGAKENGGIFLQTNPWHVIAQTLVGDGDKAYQYHWQIMPSRKNDIADRYEVEPYVYCQNILGKEHPQFGLGRNSWLTGTASWAMVAASQYILGIKPDYHGLIIDPCIPSKWASFEVKRIFRGSTYHISVKNPKGVCKGVKTMMVDGKRVVGNRIPVSKEKREHKVEITLG